MTTIPKPGDRVLVPATVESPGHDDEHIIVKVGGTPVQVASSAAHPPVGEELVTVRKQAQRYLEARYGESVWYRAPETFDNTLERWIWAVASDAPPLAEECMSAIEQHFREGLTPMTTTTQTPATARAAAAEAEANRLRATIERMQAELDLFKPQPMSQRCRDGKHNGTGDMRCINCWCLCHRAEVSPEQDALVIAALDEAAADREERARFARLEGRTDEERGHLDTASQYRELRDRLEAGQ